MPTSVLSCDGIPSWILTGIAFGYLIAAVLGIVAMLMLLPLLWRERK